MKVVQKPFARLGRALGLLGLAIGQVMVISLWSADPTALHHQVALWIAMVPVGIMPIMPGIALVSFRSTATMTISGPNLQVEAWFGEWIGAREHREIPLGGCVMTWVAGRSIGLSTSYAVRLDNGPRGICIRNVVCEAEELEAIATWVDRQIERQPSAGD